MTRFSPVDFGTYSVFTTAYDVEEHASDRLEEIDAEEPGHILTQQGYLTVQAEDVEIPDAPQDDTDRPITLLMDCSGSMKGGPLVVTLAALLRVGDALAAQGRRFEILGFTTASWKGGQPRIDWVTQGRTPNNPGRLAALRHIVFKDLSESWDDTRLNLSYGFATALTKENIDGEALGWAASRALAHQKEGDIAPVIVTISDGAPVDQSTLSVNPATFLEDHLDAVRTGLAPHAALACVKLYKHRTAHAEDIIVGLPDHGLHHENFASHSGNVARAVMTAIETAAVQA